MTKSLAGNPEVNGKQDEDLKQVEKFGDKDRPKAVEGAGKGEEEGRGIAARHVNSLGKEQIGGMEVGREKVRAEPVGLPKVVVDVASGAGEFAGID